MKPALEFLPRSKDNSFVAKSFDYKYYPTPWHYHPEYEIVLVTESAGRRLIGDHIGRFEPGNLALIGPNIPHTYKNDEAYYKSKNKLRAKSIVIHFLESSIGADFLDMPEGKKISQLLKSAGCCFDVKGRTNKLVTEKMNEVLVLTGFKKWMVLMEILYELAHSGDLIPITKIPQSVVNEKESDRMCAVLDWIATNFEKEIRLTDAAAIANMNMNAFSRFFSQRTRKTFSGFIKELRLQKASQLLMEDEMSVTEICFDCGYNNISNFNRQFLQHYHLSPLQYKKQYRELH